MTPQHPARSTPRVVLFDLDDTLLDSTGAAHAAWRALCDGYAPRLGVCGPDDLLAAIVEYRTAYWRDPLAHRRSGRTLDDVRRSTVAAALYRFGIAGGTAASVAEEIASAYEPLREELAGPFPGALDAVRRLRALGARLALLTNGEAGPQRRKIERNALAPLFDCILIDAEFGAGKPDPRVFRHCVQACGASLAEAWMVGDRFDLDVVPARTLGIWSIWVDNAGAGVPADAGVWPDRVIHSVAELP